MIKVLVTAHLGRHFRIFGHYDYKVLLSMGFEVHIAANFENEIDHFEDPNVIIHQIDFDRNPFSLNNLKAFNQLKRLFSEVYFDIIHCQSPSGGAVTRLAAIKTRNCGSKIIYTAHGFHFFKGAPLRNWILYFNLEKFFSIHTDTIITINNEDYSIAKEKLLSRGVKKINGVGIDLCKFNPPTYDEKQSLRLKYGYSQEDFILIVVGELSYRKHQDIAINAINIVNKSNPNVKLILVGTGELKQHYEDQVNRLGLMDNIQFLGYRKDIYNLMKLSDVAVSASRQEGLPVNVMEAMATSLPLVVTDCRGNRDLITDGENGFLVGIDNVDEMAFKIKSILDNSEMRKRFSKKNLEVIGEYSYPKVRNQMIEIYKELL